LLAVVREEENEIMVLGASPPKHNGWQGGGVMKGIGGGGFELVGALVSVPFIGWRREGRRWPVRETTGGECAIKFFSFRRGTKGTSSF
jgi:hypothetical protein